MITGLLNRAEMLINATTGDVSLSAVVELQDDTLGPLAARQHVVVDPMIVAQVVGFVDAMLPTLSAALGVPVSRPGAAPVEPPVQP